MLIKIIKSIFTILKICLLYNMRISNIRYLMLTGNCWRDINYWQTHKEHFPATQVWNLWKNPCLDAVGFDTRGNNQRMNKDGNIHESKAQTDRQTSKHWQIYGGDCAYNIAEYYFNIGAKQLRFKHNFQTHVQWRGEYNIWLCHTQLFIRFCKLYRDQISTYYNSLFWIILFVMKPHLIVLYICPSVLTYAAIIKRYESKKK